MKTVLITGAGGLVGGTSTRYFSHLADRVVGIDNDMRKVFFGEEASTSWHVRQLREELPNYMHHNTDIRDQQALERIFNEHGNDIDLIVHTAAQPSHDKAAQIPFLDFEVNANGTLNLLEMARQHCPKAVFIFTSTNKVYGDAPNNLPLVELETRWEVAKDHPYYEHGIDEHMTIDQSKHSLFGASKVAADIMVQEYGRYFGMNTGVFRGGCLTGPKHSGTQLHGFLSYLMKCAMDNRPYTIFGYKGKQVRDNIHSDDLVTMFDAFRKNPKQGAVYNAGGGRFANCSMLEAIGLCEKITGNKLNITLSDQNRAGDHIWYVSDLSRFRSDYPQWHPRYGIAETLVQIHEEFRKRPH
ncbi:MAG TPA: NAD-dependent epimerase/dehydratase family protein [Flavobacteriales bacterium]|nr:NAD-dependent epimerase/dehydratase family protein [Flavobacteriales bacterium]HRO39475.1 NAD-dependent epimerase/dehydratase family protein [Flavobacteriales bacterium]HRQ83618.1 NAD-dependent epimerase/dehydratase family protein [Flavobacteriales bacterium]